jgi:hypothetical protein
MFLSSTTTYGRILTAAVLLLAGLSQAASTAAQEKPEKQETKDQPASFWMKKKLDYAQNILSGIALGDFDKIAQNGEAMRGLSKIEGFFRRQMPGYGGQLQIFEQAVDEIIRQANKDNVDGAALAFTQLTISCVNCHKHIREAK